MDLNGCLTLGEGFRRIWLEELGIEDFGGGGWWRSSSSRSDKQSLEALCIDRNNQVGGSGRGKRCGWVRDFAGREEDRLD